MRSLRVVLVAPGFDDSPGIVETQEPVFVQALVAELAIPALDVRVLVRLARPDEGEPHVVAVSPLVEHLAVELFDLHEGLKQLTLEPEKVIACFDHYLALDGKPITRAIAEQRMLGKLTRSLTEDITPLLPVGIQFGEMDAIHAFERVWIELIARMGGEGWKLAEPVLEELRVKRFPGLLTSGISRGVRDFRDNLIAGSMAERDPSAEF